MRQTPALLHTNHLRQSLYVGMRLLQQGVEFDISPCELLPLDWRNHLGYVSANWRLK